MDKDLQHQIWHDDPKNWKLGFIYYNKADNRWFPPKRAGFGYTLNFANPITYMYLILIFGAAIYFKHNHIK
jgi:uncharacterized membrane protein